MVFGSIMSGDSPNSHANDIFDFKEGRHSPTPTTSKDIGVQNTTNFVTASVLVEPNKEEKDPRLELCSPIAHQEYKSDDDISNNEQTLKLQDSSKSDDNKGSPKKINGGPDTLDGPWVPPSETKKDEDDDSCIVKCLYYTMQCCECTIM